MEEPQTTQLLLHGVIDARIVAADLSVTSDGQLQPTKKVTLQYILFFLFCLEKTNISLERFRGS